MPTAKMGIASARRLLATPDSAGTARAVVCLGAVIAFKVLFDFASGKHPNAIPLVFAAVVAGAAAFSTIRYRDTSAAYAALLRGVAVAAGLFVVLHPPTYDLTEVANQGSWSAFLTGGYYLSIAATGLALWRPSWSLVPCAFMQLHTLASNHVTPIGTGVLDYIPVAQTGMFLSIGLMAAFCVEHLRRRWERGRQPVGFRPCALGPVSNMIAAGAIGLHLASYFYSAIAKLTLNGGPTSWLLTNDASNRLLAALDNGVLPTGPWPELTSLIYEQVHAHHVAANAIVIVAQLAAAIAVTRPRLIALLTLLFDLFHVGIYLTSGANFWPWLALNLSIALACTRFRPGEFGRPHAIAGLAFLLFSYPVFYVASLGWYDTRANNRHYFVAELDDGALHEVPASFFGSKSYPVAYTSIGTPPGHFPTHSIGSVLDFRMARTAAAGCAFAPEDRRNRFMHALDNVDAFVRQHHRYVLANADAAGRFAMGGRFDHFSSDPRLVAAFAAVDTRRIVAFRYIVESSCLGYDDGRLTRSVDHRSERRIDVRGN